MTNQSTSIYTPTLTENRSRSINYSQTLVAAGCHVPYDEEIFILWIQYQTSAQWRLRCYYASAVFC